MELKRVVVTGLGALTPVGNDLVSTWQAIKSGKSGVDTITQFDPTNYKTQFAGEIKDFDFSSVMDRKEARKLDRYSQFAVYTAKEALTDSGLDLTSEDLDRIGVIWGSGMGGILTMEDGFGEYTRGDGTPHFNPFYIPKAILNMGAGQISLYFGLRGVNFATASACSSSASAIVEAYNYLRLGKAEVIVTGGSDATITYSGIGGFNSMHALSTRNDSPETASRPFSKSRDGFILSEGAACLILEEYEHAKARGAKIYAELAGAALNADAYHMTAPDPEGVGAAKVMKLALEDAMITPAEVDYINAHGTSTPLGDIAEVKAIERVWGSDAERLNISSTKSMTGHMVGAAGAAEALFTVMAIYEGVVPPTINHDEGDDDENINPRLNFTFNAAQKRDLRYAITNAFGFGGHNSCIVFKKA